MNKQVIIIGAGGHSKVIADIVRLNNDKVFGVLDDNSSLRDVIGPISTINKFRDYFCIVAIGDNMLRQKITNLYNHKIKWYTAIHPSAVIAADSEIGDGSVIMANAVINSGSVIGKGVIVNTSSSIDHDCYIEDFSHISVGSHLAGTVNVGQCTLIGAGAVVINNISICDHCIIGAGSVVVNSIVETGTYVGLPARKMKYKTFN